MDEDKAVTVWNEELESAVKEIGDESKGYKIMHIHMAQTANQMYTKLTMLGILLGPLSSLLSGIEAMSNPYRHSVLAVITICLGFLSGVTVAVIKFGKYDEVSNANKTASARYTSLESNVRRQLSLQRKDRIPAMTYMEWLESKYEELFMSAPLLPRNVYDKYINAAKKQGLAVPQRYKMEFDIEKGYTESKKAEITDISDIHVTRNSTDTRPPVESIMKSTTFSSMADLNMYSDNMLQYEIGRLNK